jgi:hypothetical protein
VSVLANKYSVATIYHDCAAGSAGVTINARRGEELIARLVEEKMDGNKASRHLCPLHRMPGRYNL